VLNACALSLAPYASCSDEGAERRHAILLGVSERCIPVSIVKTRAFLEKSGCGVYGSLALGVVFIIGFLWVRGGSQPGNSGREGESTVLFSIGDLSVSGALWGAITGDSERSENGIEKLPVQYRAQMLAQELSTAVQLGYALAAAKKAGIDIGDKQVDAEVQREENDELEMEATRNKQTAAQLRNSAAGKQILALVQKRFTDLRSAPGGDDFVRAIAASRALSDHFRRQFNPSDDEVKHSGDTLMLRDIVVHANGGKDADVQKKVDAVLAEIKKDGFVKVADKYATAGPTADVSADSKPMPRPRSDILATPAFAPLKDLKPGETSKPVNSGAGYTLFNLVEVKDNSPKDFDKQKEEYRKSYIDQLTNGAVDKAILDVQSETKIEWKDSGFEALYKFAQATRSMPSFDLWLAVAKDAAQAIGNSSDGGRMATYVRYSATDEAWKLATPKQREAIQKDRIEALSGVLDYAEDFQIRIDLADAFIDAKNAKGALDQLQNAAGNISDFDKPAEDRFSQIDLRTQKLLAEKLVGPNDLAGIQKAHDDWVKAKQQADQEKASESKVSAKTKEDLQSQEQDYIDRYKKAHGGRAPSDLVGNGSSGTPPSGK
jgi:hypothetical protein